MLSPGRYLIHAGALLTEVQGEELEPLLDAIPGKRNAWGVEGECAGLVLLLLGARGPGTPQQCPGPRVPHMWPACCIPLQAGRRGW